MTMDRQPDRATLSLRVVDAIQSIPAERWDALAETGAIGGGRLQPANPFLSHAFLSALEDSGCVGERNM